MMMHKFLAAQVIRRSFVTRNDVMLRILTTAAYTTCIIFPRHTIRKRLHMCICNAAQDDKSTYLRLSTMTTLLCCAKNISMHLYRMYGCPGCNMPKERKLLRRILAIVTSRRLLISIYLYIYIYEYMSTVCRLLSKRPPLDRRGRHHL